MNQHPLSPSLVAQEMERRFFELIWSGTAWLSAADIAARTGDGTVVTPELLAQWETNVQLFSMERDGVKVYPAYAFAADFTPLPAMAAVLQVLLRDRGSTGFAAFFESPSAFLHGSRPRELLASEPDRVLAKAIDEVEANEFAG